MLRPDHVTVDEPPEATPNPLPCKFEDALGQGLGQERLAMVTAEGHQVSLPGLLEPLSSPGQDSSLAQKTPPLKPKPGLSGPPA